ncbi:D-alanyl-D-alanine carboxypeptidase [Lentzea albidocapillata subsp. violacea]|uniref:D-alanyl-D-alanine carboxypeptidase n=1 Tax=Lentzea albidocapillata subsp. violacea TaxID=128104 RepID=A0A1G9LKJ9_9PSEU|nr:serine hydrolase domain-containing protein [Lentzea albidocapillata]SDL62519.1 D-alanyl-D-alanine carboxypeptidase [Lentzea albidocapillata subsp. violacea]
MKKTLVGVLATAMLFTGTAMAAPASDVQKQLDGLTKQHEFPAALATVTDGNGRTVAYTSGTSVLNKRTPVPRNGQVRAGSNTKAFVAAVVMQLVGEGKVELDKPINHYLPGAIKDDRITVRQLLNHTSGLANYTQYLGDFEGLRHRYFEPRELLDIGNAQPVTNQPGEKFKYSNTNYVLLGLLIQKVTGRPVAENVDQRIVRKLNLKDTYWPGVGEQGIRGKHAHGYAKTGNGIEDVTEMDPSWGWAAGQIISTTKDLNTFYRGLLKGDLVKKAQLDEMKKTVDTAGEMWPGVEYGLGIASVPLSCGGRSWGHGGDIHGYETRGGVTDSGRAFSVAVTALPGTFQDTPEEAGKAHDAVLATVDAALCGAK